MVNVQEIMRSTFVALEEDALMGRVEAEMRIADVRHVLLVDAHGRLAGILSRGDLVRALEKEARGPVREHMTRRVWTVRPNDPAVKAVDLMIERNVGAIVVIDDDERPVGLVSETELLRRARADLAAG